VSLDDTDIDALLDQAKLDGESGPATPLAPATLDREIAGLLERRDAVLRGARGRRQWYLGAAVGAVAVGVGLLAPVGLRQATRAVDASDAPPPVLRAPHDVVPATSEVGQTAAREDAAIDVTSLPSAVETGPTFRAIDPSAPAPLPQRNEAESAEDLLRTANLLRAKREWQDAARTYERVIDKYESSGQAYPAMLAAAALRLERLADPAGALRFYQRAIDARPSGALAEEARFGEARSYRALGQTDAERAALLRFLSNHPSSWRAAEARDRYRELGEGLSETRPDGPPASGQ
jgi:tetratricopeptide (TPR) repeat protein